MSNKLVEAKEEQLEEVGSGHLIALALEKGADPKIIEKLMDLQERWEAGKARKAYVLAMSAFKQEAPAVLIKGDAVEFITAKGRTAYKYANLGSIVQEITSLLGKHNLSASWETSQTDKGDIVVTCHITHSEGHREDVTLRGPADESGNKNRIQAIGSTVTYLQRYTLLAALGLATGEDEDGRDGSMDTKKNKPPTAQPQEKQHEVEMSAKEKLAEALKDYCGDTSEEFKREVLNEITSFTDEKTGQIRCIGKFNDPKFSDKWAQAALGKLREKIKKEKEIDEIVENLDIVEVQNG
jgi:hypothetical protein